jgi:PAS domain S-box-containing protein
VANDGDQRARRRSPLRTRTVAVVLIPTLAMVGGALALLFVQHASGATDRAVAHHSEVEASVQRVLALLVDAETGVRGYAGTGDKRFLAPYDAATSALPDALGRFQRAIVLGDGDGAEVGPGEAAAFVGLVRREQAELATLRGLAPGPPNATRTALAVGAKATMDSARAWVERVVAEQDRAVLAHRAAQQRNHGTALLLLCALGAVAFAGGLGAATFVATQVSRRLARVEDNARRLAAGEPPLPSPKGPDDEIAALDRSLAEAATLIAGQRDKLDLALSLGGISLWEITEDGRLVDVRPAQAVRVPDMEAALAYLHPDDRPHIRAELASAFATGEPLDYEARRATPDPQWMHTRVTRVSRPGGHALVGVQVDVTALKRAEVAIRENERYAAAEAVARAEERGRHSELLVSSAGEGIFAAGADGLCTSANPAAARMLGYEVSDLIGCDPHALFHHSFADGAPYPPHTCPILVALQTGAGQRIVDEVFWRRDGTRLPVDYSAFPLTESGVTTGVVVTFVDATERTALRTELDADAERLRQGIREGELVLHYQPKIDLTTGGCEAVEALVRWQRDGTLVMPDDFIPLAEETGVIHELTEWVITTAVRQAAAWRTSPTPVRVAVNLSPLSLRDDRIVDHLATAAGEAGIPASLIEIEITESALAEQTESLLSNLAHLRAMGVRTAIDDFGTGFASLSYLKHLPVSAIKIDKSFVMNMPKDPRDQAIVAAVVHMAHSLGLKVVAEGVEDLVVVRLLGHADCDIGQGFHWSRAVPADELARWLAARQPARV